MSDIIQKPPFWRKFFGPPSKELADVRAMTNGVKHSARLLRISAAMLNDRATELAEASKMMGNTTTWPSK